MSNVTFIGKDPDASFLPDVSENTSEEAPKELPSLLIPLAFISAGFFAWELLT